jgi:hypothetical protein
VAKEENRKKIHFICNHHFILNRKLNSTNSTNYGGANKKKLDATVFLIFNFDQTIL